MPDTRTTDDTLDRLDWTVDHLTSTASISVLQQIQRLARSNTCSREVVDFAQSITASCNNAYSALMESYDKLIQDDCEDSARHLESALQLLDGLSLEVEAYDVEAAVKSAAAAKGALQEA